MSHDVVHAAKGLFAETAEGPRLLGSRCTTCSTPYFPRASVCHNPDCDESRIEDASFGPRGVLWSCAIQNYAPPPPVIWDEPFQPYAVGLVDMPEGLRVLGRIATADPEDLEVGGEVELVIEALATGEDGKPIVAWQFKPL
jgi:uncharacterized OB-fold protein